MTDTISKTTKVWLMRLSAMLLLPAFLLAGVELILRFTGYGYETDYLLPTRVQGEDFLIPNYKFSHRFFPPHLARTPSLFRIPANKPEGTYRIFVFGASAALGDPDPNYGIGAHMESLLEARYPDTNFEVFNVAMTAINSHVVLPMARECSKLDGDLWIVYLGNNEMVGPFGAGTIFGAQAPPVWLVRTGLFFKSMRLGQWVTSLSYKVGSGSSSPQSWDGINMFKQYQLRHTDPVRMKAFDNFRKNLEDIVSIGRKVGVPVVLSTVGSNLEDCSPFSSSHRENLEPAQQLEWDALFEEGGTRESNNDVSGALACYLDAEAIDPEFAELHFRKGICLLSMGRVEEAAEAFERSRDLDSLAVRADKRINEIILSVAENSGDHVLGVDAATALKEMDSNQILGKELFFEHVHLTPEGNFRLASIIAKEADQLLPNSIRSSRQADWLGMDTCHKHLALTLWDRLRLWMEMSERIQVPPFIDQSSHADNVAYLNSRSDEIKERITTKMKFSRFTLVSERALYDKALLRNPGNTRLIGNFAQFLDANKVPVDSIAQARSLRDMLPDFAWAHYYLGMLLGRNGNYEEARASLQRAIELSPDFTQAEEALLQVKRKLRKQLPGFSF